jgi:hypothetical protein
MMHAAQVRATVGASQPGLVPSPGDFFRTSPEAVRALLLVEPLVGSVWEPACGNGDISKELKRCAEVSAVYSSDLYDRGYGETGVDFLTARRVPEGVRHVVTNPPFNLIDEFAKHAISLKPEGKICLFGRLAWLEGARRRRDIFDVTPPSRVWVFSTRPKLARGDGEWVTGLIAFAWFVWSRGERDTRLGWI